MFDLKGHIRSNKALYVYIFSSNNSSIKPLLSLYASLSFLSTLQPRQTKKIEGELLLTVLLLPSPSLTLSLCLSIFPLPLSFFFSLSLFSILHLNPTSALNPPYASLSFLSLSFFSSLHLFFIPPPLHLHWPYIHPMPLYLFFLPCSSSLFFNPNLRSYGQLFVLVFVKKGCGVASWFSGDWIKLQGD